MRTTLAPRSVSRWLYRVLLPTLAVVLFATLAQAGGKSSPPRTPSVGSYPEDSTDVKIYREFEICMNEGKAKVDENKLEGQAIAARCMMQLKKYGDSRAKKAFKFYFDLD